MSTSAKKTADLIGPSVEPCAFNQARTYELSTKSKILRSAIRIFAKYGFNGASLRQITDAAGLNHGLIRYHYKNKDTLWKACVTFLYDQLSQAHRIDDDSWRRLTRREKTEHLARQYTRFCANNPELLKILMFETLEEGERHDWIIETFLKPQIKKSIAQIRRGQEEDVFPSSVEGMNIYYIMASANRTLFLQSKEIRQVFGADIFSENEIQKHEDALVKLFLD